MEECTFFTIEYFTALTCDFVGGFDVPLMSLWIDALILIYAFILLTLFALEKMLLAKMKMPQVTSQLHSYFFI